MTPRPAHMLAAAVAATLRRATAVPATPQVARPLPGGLSAAAGDAITPVQWRWHGPGAAGAGFAAGLLLGGLLASRPYYWGYGPPVYAPPPVYVSPPVYDDDIAYCWRRFKSYDPRSGTYLGYDGYRHPCP